LKRRSIRSPASHEPDEQQDPLKQTFYFQDLPPDIKMIVLQGVKFRASRTEVLPEDVVMFDLAYLLDEEADDIINRHNRNRTIKGWLDFAERGE
jgi:hypothetical protein